MRASGPPLVTPVKVRPASRPPASSFSNSDESPRKRGSGSSRRKGTGHGGQGRKRRNGGKKDKRRHKKSRRAENKMTPIPADKRTIKAHSTLEATPEELRLASFNIDGILSVENAFPDGENPITNRSIRWEVNELVKCC